ncbi:MAG TPA: hypothetical protein VNT51_05670 [Miltoncostaeaceae bacterium]|nr:hypothetical protein [Miltoncostaeaceae bacterium]
MRLRTLAVLGVAAYIYSKGPRDPREWVAFLGEQAAVLREQITEAVEAGRRASARRQEQIDRELAQAMGRPGPGG